MKTKKVFVFSLTLIMLISMLGILPVGAQSGGTTRQIPVSGTTSIQPGSSPAGDQGAEIAGGEGDEGANPYSGSIVNRSYSKGSANGPSVKAPRSPNRTPCST